MNKAKVFYVPESIYVYPEEELGNEGVMIYSIRQDTQLSSYLREKGVMRGDVIVFGEEDGYRNDYRFMYDGRQVVTLDFSPPCGYYYGIVPKEFLCIHEFLIGYWDEALRGWNLNWIHCSDTLEENILKNAVPYFRELIWKSVVEIDGNEIEVYIETRESTLEESISNHFVNNRSNDLICVSSYNDGADCDLPRGANIVHILDE